MSFCEMKTIEQKGRLMLFVEFATEWIRISPRTKPSFIKLYSVNCGNTRFTHPNKASREREKRKKITACRFLCLFKKAVFSIRAKLCKWNTKYCSIRRGSSNKIESEVQQNRSAHPVECDVGVLLALDAEIGNRERQVHLEGRHKKNVKCIVTGTKNVR